MSPAFIENMKQYLPVDCDVESHQFNEGFIITEAKESWQIVGVVLWGINGRKFAFAKDITINTASDVG